LIEREENTIHRYRNWAGLFIDLPQTHTSIKPRTWLVNCFKALFRKQTAYLYLFWHSFLRSESFVMFLRLQIWVILLFFCLPYIWVGLGLLLLSLWFAFLQIQSLVAFPRFPIWVRLYPLTKQDHRYATSRFAFSILLIQTGILTIGMLITGFLSWWKFFPFFVIGLILSWAMAKRIA
jgi:predicted ABC-type exoprotein transport system permease subunit